jgi:hypothetical protein
MIKKIITATLVVAATVAILNIPLTTRQGVNHELKVLKIPLYIKTIEFLDRDYRYAELAGEITKDKKTDKDKALAIFNWVVKNIHQAPGGFDIIDDHILNIIIRRYGTPDQMADVFTTLCSYAGIPVFWDMCYDTVHNFMYPVAFAKFDGSWYVVDCHRGEYFRASSNEADDIGAILKSVASEGGGGSYKGVPYKEIYGNLKPTNEVSRARPAQQMLFGRIAYEAGKIFRCAE